MKLLSSLEKKIYFKYFTIYCAKNGISKIVLKKG